MPRLKRALPYIALGVALAYGGHLGYLAQLNYTGYCHAEGKYLTDDEKIRGAVADVLKTYPRAVYLAGTREEELRIGRPPPKTIPYQDVDDFLRLNPACCSVTFVRRNSEGATPEFLARIVGAPSGFVNVNYVVRYWNTNNQAQSKEVKTSVPISNCGKPVHWWNPLHSDSFFIIQYFKHKDTL